MDSGDLLSYAERLGFSERGTALLALIRAVASTPGFPDLRVAVRAGPEPVLSFWGEPSPSERRRLATQVGSLSDGIRDLRYVNSPEVERLCERLAEKLREHLGAEVLGRASFVALPRGGHFVLGPLAYLLGLRRDQLLPSPPSDADLVVIVDDCALTGHRFGNYLAGQASERVVFAHLLSAPGLRRALEDAEPAVRACMAADDLEDLAPSRRGRDAKAWRHRWRDRLDPPRYWIGWTRPIAFPWCEPDRSCWDPVSEEVVPTLHLAPPELCLKNRASATGSAAATELQPEGSGPLRPSPRALCLDDGKRVWLADRDTGEVLELEGAGTPIWRWIIAHGELEGVLRELVAGYDAGEEILRADLEAFVADLLDRGLLQDDA